MQTIKLYRFIRPDGGVTVSAVKPDTDYTELTRLVADDGMVLTDGVNSIACTDTADPDKWQEVPDLGVDEMTEVEQKAAAYDIITGVSE